MQKKFTVYGLWKVMKISMIQLTIAMIFGGVALAADNYAQEVLEREVSISLKDATVRKVLKEIELNTKVKFIYSSNHIKLNDRVSVDFNKAKLGEVLSSLLMPQSIDFEVQEQRGYIVLSPRKDPDPQHADVPLPVENEVASKPVAFTVSGTVTDEVGNAMPGVNIIAKGTSTGTTTDTSGKYSLSLDDGTTILVFSFIGYATQEITIEGKTTIDVQLIPDLQSLEEVVVVGYNTVKKADITGSVVSVGQQDLRARPMVNALEAMQGKAAGVDITSNERPGEIGTIRIRGERSINATNEPLYVVDGIPVMSRSGIETLNPLDIQSIDVLKDASATAIYGSRGANGVIIVTTKKGTAGKTTLSYSGTVTTETIQDRTEMMNASEYITWRRWAYYYADPVNNPRGDEPTQAKDFVYFNGAKDPTAWSNIEKGWEGGSWDGSKVKTTRWEDMVTQTGITHVHNLSLSSGTEKVRASGSFGYLNNEGTLKGQEFTRYSTNLSVILNPLKWFEFGLTINASYGIQDYGHSNAGGTTSGPGSIYAAARANFPFSLPYNADGNRVQFPGGDDLVKTVVDEWKYSENQRTTLRTLGSMYAQATILPGLRYRVSFGPDFRNYKDGIFLDAKSVNRAGTNYAALVNQNDFSWTLDNLLYYDKTIDKHNIGVTLLQSASSWVEEGSAIRGQNIPLPSMKWNALSNANITGTNLLSYGSSLQERQLMSYMARISYGWNDKYLLTASGRWDGASQLADGNKWSFFPSAALAWRMEQEPFIADISWVNELKLRVGYGVTGNAAIDPYRTKGGIVSLFYPFGGTLAQGYAPSESLISGGNTPMANPNLGWEKTGQLNVGLDFALFNGRLSGTIDGYTTHTTDLLLEATLPPLTGFNSTFENVGETRGRGIDITLNTVNLKRPGAGDLTWETSVNLAYNKNEIVKLANGDDIGNSRFEGESLGVIYGYESNGIWREEDAEEMQKFNDKTPGLFQVGKARPVDQNGDYLINANFDRVVIGNTRPRWTVGMTNTVAWKNFDLSIFIFGRLGYMFNTNGEAQLGRYVQRKIDYYNENNKDAEYQKPIYNIAGGDTYSTILGPRNASFLKIRYINLGYSFPRDMISKWGMENLKVYVQARNPGMVYSQIDWLDMDLGGSTWNRGFVFGLNVDF